MKELHSHRQLFNETEKNCKRKFDNYIRVMKFIIYISVIVFLMSCATNYGTLIPVPCGTYTALAYKYPEKYYEVAIKAKETDIRNSINILNKIIDTTSVYNKQTITVLRDNLNQFGGLSQEIIKAKFLSCNQDPCDREAKKAFDNLLANLSGYNYEVAKFNQVASKPQNTKSVKNAVKELSIATARTASQQATLIVNTETKTKGGDKPATDPTLSNLAVIVDKTEQRKEFWVYLGSATNLSVWDTKYFDFESVPKNGDVIQSRGTVYKRDSYPTYNDGWIYGAVVGVVKPNDSVKILSVKVVAETFYWARVILLPI